MTTDVTTDNVGSDPRARTLAVLFVVGGFVVVLVLVWLVFWLTHRTGVHYEVLSLRIHGTILTVAAIVVATDAGLLAYVLLAQATIGAIGIAASSLPESSVAWLSAFVVWLILYLIWVFSFTYYLLGSPQHWNMPLSHVDAIYVTVGTLTTAGTTGISARGDLTRGVLTGQMAFDLLVVTVLLALVLHRAMQAAQSKSAIEMDHPKRM